MNVLPFLIFDPFRAVLPGLYRSVKLNFLCMPQVPHKVFGKIALAFSM